MKAHPGPTPCHDYQADAQFQDRTITTVKKSGEWWEVKLSDGWTIGVQPYAREPKIGDVIRMWGRGLGYEVRGIAIAGTLVRYESAADHEARLKRELAEDEAKRRASYLERKQALDARIAALPPVLAADLRRELTADPAFAWGYCGLEYNLFAFEQGVIIAAALHKSGMTVEDFAQLGWKQQFEIVPGLDGGHSGGTFGTALRAAYSINRLMSVRGGA